MKKKLLGYTLFFIIIGIMYFSYQYYANNKAADWPDQQSLQTSFYKSVQWLSANYPKIQDQHNPALWWMIKETSDINNNKTLAHIFQIYKAEYLDANPTNIWTPYFRKFYRPLVPDISAFDDYSPYQTFFVYALSCNKQLEQEPIIQEQLEADFCGMHYLSPRCVTRQLMAVRLMQDRYCGDDQQLAELSKALQNTIIDELIYDFRVTDSYLQRVLMLAESRNFAAIKPVWIQRILAAQNDDGGWDDAYPVLSLSDTKVLGWSSAMPGLLSTKSNFHATAQGIWLMALLLQHADAKTNIDTNTNINTNTDTNTDIGTNTNVDADTNTKPTSDNSNDVPTPPTPIGD